MTLLTLPFCMPLVEHCGLEPVCFGVLFLISTQLGLLVPPCGLLLFTMKTMAQSTSRSARSTATPAPTWSSAC